MAPSPSHDRRLPSPPFPSNPTLVQTQSQWLFALEDLQRTPSVLDGLTMATEHDNRAKGVNFITQVGIMLKLPQLTLATASVFLHRFFMRYSMVDRPGRAGLHHYAVAATSLFLATKVEESSRRMKELIIACCRVAQKQPNMIVDEQSKEYWKWRDTILHNEDLLLEALCFDLQLEQPYRFLYDFLVYYNVQDNKILRNAAWAFINDSTLTVLCLLFSSRTIAASALYAAAKHTGVAFPDDEYGRPWWQYLGINIKDIKRACNRMADAYESSALLRQSDKGTYARTPEEADEATAKTRIMSTSSIHHLYSPAGSVGSDSQGVKRDREDVPDDGLATNGTGSHDFGMEESRSPKRQRQHNGSEENRGSQPPPLPPPPPPAESDDVQSRIDAIINANPRTQSNPRPSLSREGSSQNQAWQYPPTRRRSRSSSHRRSVVDSYMPDASMSGRRASYDRGSRGGSYERERETSRVENGANGRRTHSSGQGAEDAEGGNGSEEGEL